MLTPRRSFGGRRRVPRALRRREGRRREPTVGGTPPWRGRWGARGSWARRAGCRYRARGISIPGRPRRPRAPSRPGSPSLTRKVKRARLPRGRESKFCDPVGGFLPGGVLGAFPVRLRCRPRLDSTRAGALERYEAPVRVCGTGTEPRPRAVNGRGAKEAWLQVTRVHFSSSIFQCLISLAATRPSSVFNFGVIYAKL